ncbi:MAG: HAD-IIIC family phosphatase, partial [Acidobacteriota bacterium]
MNENIPERVVVAANFTVEPISKTLTSLLTKITGMHDLVFAPYNQIFGQLLDPASLFHTNRNGVNILFVRLEDLIESRGADIEYIRSKLDEIKSNAADLAKMLGVAERFSVPLFVFLCQASTGIQTDLELTTAFDGVEKVIHETASDFSNLFVFPTDYVASRYEVAAIDNPRANVLGHVPYTDSYMSALAVEAVRKIDAYRRSPLKVLVLDCDNTLWDGVVGEDGVEGIGCSEKRSFLQNFAVKQSESGMVVCLNSKNNEADVWEVFDKRTDMVLKKEHIVSSRINWLPKSENLRSIADELQLALDSFVFVDDDPVVCDEVRRNCPEALTVLLPLGSDDYCKFFEHLWIFDKLKITREDRERTRSYRDQGVRRELQSQAGDMTEFLASLKLVCEISELKSQDIPRVSQLTLRTNQFNSTTLRLSEADVRERISRDNKVIWTVRVSDRFGDYGLVGVVIFEVLQRSISVESFMLSCRVLGRGVEHQILKALGKKALVADREFVTLDYAPTAKNAPILNFLTEINEGLETADTGRVIYKVPAIVAVESSPRRAQIQEPSASIVGAELQTGMSSRVSDPDRFQVYIELANELSKSGYLSFNGISADLSRDTLRSEFRRAGTVTERTLTQIWERLLNANNIGIADNFFEIGGDSLVAVTLFLEIEEQFDRRLPISSLLDSPTIEKLARIIDFETDPTAWKYLVPIQVQGTKPPLFCMHAAGGNVLFYRDLATGLGNDQ